VQQTLRVCGEEALLRPRRQAREEEFRLVLFTDAPTTRVLGSSWPYTLSKQSCSGKPCSQSMVV